MNEDIELVSEVLNGNIDSFNILVNKYELIVLRFVYSITKDKEASEDIAQETFITAYNKLYLYDKKYKFSNWLLQISKNKAIDFIRKFKRVYEANIEDARDVKSKEASPQEQLEFVDLKKEVTEFIQSLEEVDRQIILLRYSGERTFFDISQILSISESSVKRKYYRLRDKFKNSLYYNKTLGQGGAANEMR
ncbi:sigma-70 family RNA polymerase sigma factor [Clostridium sp. YIM B02505]|uniref:Sigma-70 family RNA polymerase sigma factor n=1 Tax=Clostridium yunnanense TaxID=2800325 RepID=A0ABS1ET26_9CLOT|nr:sigma-70 family RNA polymerase sigma factor [Clostridium yunnanense]MBK1812500.1 sigma-70 family RNA polymerase sigma factor [Clostridium yunnanense]